jgi:hypothetical protein
MMSLEQERSIISVKFVCIIFLCPVVTFIGRWSYAGRCTKTHIKSLRINGFCFQAGKSRNGGTIDLFGMIWFESGRSESGQRISRAIEPLMDLIHWKREIESESGWWRARILRRRKENSNLSDPWAGKGCFSKHKQFKGRLEVHFPCMALIERLCRSSLLNLSPRNIQLWPEMSRIYLFGFLLKQNLSRDFTFTLCLFTRNQKFLNEPKREQRLAWTPETRNLWEAIGIRSDWSEVIESVGFRCQEWVNNIPNIPVFGNWRDVSKPL